MVHKVANIGVVVAGGIAKDIVAIVVTETGQGLFLIQAVQFGKGKNFT